MAVGIAKVKEEKPTLKWSLTRLAEFLKEQKSGIVNERYVFGYNRVGFQNCCGLEIGFSFPYDTSLANVNIAWLRAKFAHEIKSRKGTPHTIVALCDLQKIAHETLEAIGFTQIDEFKNFIHHPPSTVSLLSAQVGTKSEF